ncbi:uncharacterized protein LOC132728430 [Ruditapes philippinarum]|uniref:uncharacterized protein LOC132728430 n=1 Tax=Ruditapes philippinarum TaxID=129788 RepID=UPI00295B9CC3|nr:uncharacterized protein LOC132728430 [Ruditapes philippinarum]
MADFGMLNCFSFWNLAVVFVCYTLSDIGSVYGGPFLYIPYNGTRPNNTVAREVCKSYRNCELAVIDTQSEYDRMYAYFNDTLGENFTLPTAVWIGLYWIDVTGLGNYTHFWEKSGQLEELTWSYWDGGEPNDPGSEDCARIHTNMYMRSIECYRSYDILCEGTGKCLDWLID